MSSLWARVEPLLARVQKPARYIGCEDGAITPRHDKLPNGGTVAWLLAYPDTYEIGLPNQGLQILYEILNERDDAVAERTYAPWLDLIGEMRRARRAAVLGRHPPSGRRLRPARVQPVVRARVHERARDDRPGRASRCTPPSAARRHPLVIVGGHAAFNPEPLADFIDAAVLGEGEEVVGEITELVRDWKVVRAHQSRKGFLRELSKIPGVYVPSMYEVTLRRPGDRRGPPALRRRARPPSTSAPSPTSATGRTRRRPLVPLTEVVHDRLERRGVPRLHPRLPVLPGRHDHAPGARAPGRAGPHDDRRRAAPHRLRRGQPDVAVDRRLLRHRTRRFAGCSPTPRCPAGAAPTRSRSTCRRCASTRSPSGLAGEVERRPPQRADVRARGRLVAAAPGDQQADHRGRPVRCRRLRVQPGLVADEAVLPHRAARPRPTTTRSASPSSPATAWRSASATRRGRRSPSASVGSCPSRTPRSSGSARTPRPSCSARSIWCATATRRRGGVNLKWHDPAASVAEGIASRGDRRIGAVIERVWRDGGVFQEWGEHFDLGRWERAMEAEGLSLDWYVYRHRHERRGPAVGSTSRPACTTTSCGATGRTRSPGRASRTAAGRRATTAVCAPATASSTWSPRRSRRPVAARAPGRTSPGAARCR